MCYWRLERWKKDVPDALLYFSDTISMQWHITRILICLSLKLLLRIWAQVTVHQGNYLDVWNYNLFPERHLYTCSPSRHIVLTSSRGKCSPLLPSPSLHSSCNWVTLPSVVYRAIFRHKDTHRRALVQKINHAATRIHGQITTIIQAFVRNPYRSTRRSRSWM